ncbi:protein YgfX [Photobacterium alginatilyticum]|uniref:protein YgfX n=1 Tax=Photobacterium alginatilyticum TaxID=1775171 RepID=UPI0040685523
MSPTTTASFADLDITPSRLMAATLTLLYVGAASLLLLSWFRNTLPFPLIIVCLEFLWFEWLQRLIDCRLMQGRLVVKSSGELQWQQQPWVIEQVKIRSRFVMLWRLRHQSQRRWLLICHDACEESEYRSLSLICHYLVIDSASK